MTASTATLRLFHDCSIVLYAPLLLHRRLPYSYSTTALPWLLFHGNFHSCLCYNYIIFTATSMSTFLTVLKQPIITRMVAVTMDSEATPILYLFYIHVCSNFYYY
ncbi:hypothetical protein BDZ91DRAFT_736871, partial [Kalaharituber pfeilii]